MRNTLANWAGQLFTIALFGWIGVFVSVAFGYETCDTDRLVTIRLGSGGESISTAPSIEQRLPDFIVRKLWLETPWGVEAYKYGRPETMVMKAQFENIGHGNPTVPVEVHFYLSRGYKEDAHSGTGAWKRVGKDIIQPQNLKVGMTHTETESIDVGKDIPEPGIWNIVACADHIYDDHNSGGAIREEHESNNCSTEAVFEVTADGQAVNVPGVDFVVTGFQILQAPTYAGDQARFGAWIKNQGTAASPSDIRSVYRIQCPGTGLIDLTDDGTKANKLGPGASTFEETKTPVTLPNVVGTCTVYFCADYQNAVRESNEMNNCAAISVTLQARPSPNLVIVKFQDESSCCTTNTGDRIKPDIWVRNVGPVAPANAVTVIYQINSPVATGNAWWTIGYGGIEPRELPPGKVDEDYMDNHWSIPKDRAWKNQWHTVRACLRADGSMPFGDPNRGDICATYGRYSKK